MIRFVFLLFSECGWKRRRAGGRPIKGPPTCQLECLYVSAYIGTGKGRRIYLGAGCCCSCCLGSHHAKVVGSLLFSSLSHEKIGGGGGGGVNIRNLKRRGRTISYCRDRTLLVQQPILSNAQENAFKVFPATIRPSPPFRLLAFEKCFGSFLGAHREMNYPELFAVLLTLSVCLRLFLSLSLSLCAVCVYV
jgi:hypothetical protein